MKHLILGQRLLCREQTLTGHPPALQTETAYRGGSLRNKVRNPATAIFLDLRYTLGSKRLVQHAGGCWRSRLERLVR